MKELTEAEKAVPPTGKSHDFTKANRYWGHNFNMMSHSDDWMTMRLAGWGGDGAGLQPINEGDTLIISGTKHPTLEYIVESIEYCRDPDDMWFADVRRVK